MSMELQFLGWALLLPGSLVSALIESVLAPLTERPSGSFAFWNVADVLYLPSCVVINVLAFWVFRRVYRRYVRWAAARDHGCEPSRPPSQSVERETER